MTTVDTKTRSARFGASPPFDLSSVAIPPGEIRAGGVPKDGIPALSNPQRIEPSDVSYLKSDDRVLGLLLGKQARAYPLPAFGETGQYLEQDLKGQKFTLRYHPAAEPLRVVEAEEGLQWMYCFWFAWDAFHRWAETSQVSG